MVTDEQLLAAWREHGTFMGVARALGRDRNTVRARLQRLWLKDGGLPPPEGFHTVQVCQDGEGNVKSVKSRPDPEEPHREAVPEGHEISGLSTFYGEGGQVVGQWVKTKAVPVAAEDLKAAFEASAANYVRAEPLPLIAVSSRERWHLLNVFAYGDPHIGLLAHARETGANFDLKIAVQDLKQSMVKLLAKVPIAGTALFLDTGDLWHAEDNRQVTPRGGNKLDVDGRTSKILEEGINALRFMLDELLRRHEQVVVGLVPGNHDPNNAIWTRIALQGMYENEPRIKFLDNADPYLYHRFGSNLFLMTHGDKRIKPQELGEIMLADRALDAGSCKHRRAFTGHIHHKNVQEFRWGVWESFNSLCAADFWHHSEGYRSARVVEAITFHERYGEQGRARVTHQEICDR